MKTKRKGPKNFFVDVSNAIDQVELAMMTKRPELKAVVTTALQSLT